MQRLNQFSKINKYVFEASITLDVPTVRPSGVLISPEVYIFTANTTAYGTVSLIADGQVVSHRPQIFEAGQTKVSFDWKVPQSDDYSSNELQARVTLYDRAITTEPATIHSHPKTISIPASELTPLELIKKDGEILAEPALIYASNMDANMRFHVTDPLGECIIGNAYDCMINESTKDNRGGLTSIMYGDQILRVRYSDLDNVLERFSITYIDPILDQWNVSLEIDESLPQEAFATHEPVIKVKYRYHSETITVFLK